MGRHHGSQQCSHRGIGNFIVGSDIGQRSVVNRKFDVGVCCCIAVSGKVLAAAGHTGLSHAANHCRSKNAHNTRIAMKSTIADDGALTIVQIQAGREGKVDAAGSQFRSHH